MRRMLCALAATLAMGSMPATAAAGEGPLAHAGRWLTDEDGRVVVLHGLNMVNKLPPYAPDALGFGADDARFIAEHGFNTVRLGIIWKALEPQPGVYDDAYLDRIAQTAELLGEAGIHVLVDFHQDMWNERFSGEGAPDWAVQDDGLPAEPDVGFPGNYITMLAVDRAFDHFWANDPGPGGVGLIDRYAAAWRHAAARLRGVDGVFGLDIFNEPWPGTPWATCANPDGCRLFDEQRLTPFTAKVLGAIRQADPERLVYYEPNVIFNNGADTHHGDTGDAAAGFSFHDYCLATTPGLPGAPPPADAGCETLEDRVFQNADLQAERTGDTPLLTEFGATDDLASIGRIVRLADSHMTSWQYWAYFNEDVCCERPSEGIVRDPARPPEGDNVKADKLAVLERPYPRAVAGTPLGWSFDPRGRAFELEYSTAPAGGGTLDDGAETEVYVPEIHYPGGYAVEVEGASVASAPGARTLRLRTEPGAERVHVRVTPAAP